MRATHARLFASLAIFQACASRPPAAPAGEVLPATASAPGAGPSQQPTQTATLDQREDLLLVTDHGVLRTLEKNGYGLGELLDGAPATDNEMLARSPGYASMARVLELDIARAAQGDPLAGTSVARHAHRLFNAKWLRSKALHFELIGVANRLDRRPFHPNGCGETRLVYRLAYAIDRNGVALASRLPLTIGLEFPYICGRAATEDGVCIPPYFVFQLRVDGHPI